MTYCYYGPLSFIIRGVRRSNTYYIYYGLVTFTIRYVRSWEMTA